MPSLFSNKRLIVLLISVIGLVVIVGLTLTERPQPTWAEQFTRDSVGFVQSLAYQPARVVAGFFETVTEIKDVYTENQHLKANLRDHAQLTARIKELEAENESLQSLLDIEGELSDYELRAAEVIMRAPDRWYQQVMINRGEKHGIRPNMAVITPDGLAGRVKSVSQFTAVVELLTDTNRSNDISAAVQGDETIYGMIEGYDMGQEALFFSKIPLDAPIEEGQSVITTGWGGIFPKGLYIGEVLEVIDDESGLSQSALIRPAANMYHLDHVYVVERSSISPLELPEGSTETDSEGEEN